MKEVVEAAVAAAREATRLDAFARRPEKASPKVNPRRRSESPFEPIHESDKEESGFEDSEGTGLLSGVESAGDVEYDDSRSEIAESEQGMQNAPRVLKIDFFNSKELESRMCDMTPTDIEEKIPDLRDDLEARSIVIAEVLEMDHSTYVRALAQRPEVYAADQFIRRACKSVVKSTTSEAKVFKARERTLRTTDIKAYRSGVGMLKRMLDFGSVTEGDDVRKLQRSLKKDVYFRVGMTKMEVREKGEKLREDHRRLPEKKREAIELNELLIEKVPSEISEDRDRSFKERLEDDEDEKERRGEERSTFEDLLEAIALRISKTERVPNASVTTKTGVEQCYNCGAASCDGWRACQKRCPTSGIKGCPCCHGAKCIYTMPKLPPREQICGAARKPGMAPEPVKLELYQKLEKKFNQIQRGETGSEEKGKGKGGGKAKGGRAVGAMKEGEDDEDQDDGPPKRGGLIFCVHARQQNQPEDVACQSTLNARAQCFVSQKPLPPPAYVGAQQSSARFYEALQRQGIAIAQSDTPDLETVKEEKPEVSEPEEEASDVDSDEELPSDCALEDPSDSESEPEWEDAEAWARRVGKAKQGTSDEHDVLSSFMRKGRGTPSAKPNVEPKYLVGDKPTVSPLFTHGATMFSQGTALPMAKCNVLTSSVKPKELSSTAVQVRCMLDTGADADVMIKDLGLRKYAAAVKQGMGIDGLSGATGSNEQLEYWAALKGAGGKPFKVDMHEVESDTIKLPVMSHHNLRKSVDGTIRYEPEMAVITSEGETSSILPEGGHYMIDVVLATTEAEAAELAGGDKKPVVTAVTKARATDPSFLQACRFGVDAQGLVQLSKAIEGLEVGKLSPETVVMINNDEALRRSRHRRRGAKHDVPAKNKVKRQSGECFVIDKWYSSVPCSMTKSTGMFHAWDASDTYGYGKPISDENAETVTDFMVEIIRKEAAGPGGGHKVKRFKIDATGIFADDETHAWAEKKVGAIIERAGGDDHEFMSIGEACMNPLTRRVESSMFRAKSAEPPVPDGQMLNCRLYELQIMNMNIATGESMTRTQVHWGQVPSARSAPMPLFWTRCSVHAIGKQRGVKGLMTDTRSSRERTARVYGYEKYADGSGRMKLIADDTREKLTRHPRDLDSLDEHVLAVAGLAGGSAVVDVKVGTEEGDWDELKLLEPKELQPMQPPRVVTKYVQPPDELPIEGETIEVLWQDAKGKGFAYHEAKVRSVDVNENGESLVKLEYTDWQGAKDKVVSHNMAKEKAEGKHPWRRVKPKKAKVGDGDDKDATKGLGGGREVAEQGGQQQQPDGKQHNTRAHARRAMVATLAVLDEAVACAIDPEVAHNTGVIHMFGDDADEYLTEAHGGSLGAASKALYAAVMRDELPKQESISVGCVAAVKRKRSSTSVWFRLVEGGELVEYKTPKTAKDVWNAPDTTEWLIEEHNAIHQSILAFPTNDIVAIEDIIAAGEKIEHLASDRRYKINQDTGMLERRKVRHAFDEARAKRRASPEELTKLEAYCTYTMPTNGLELDLFMASVTSRHCLTLLDWKDAYGLGECRRGYRYAYPPETVDLRMPDGRKACIRFSDSGIWGEGAAGYEYEETKNFDMAKAGWPKDKIVPAYYYGGPGQRSASIIDDMMVATLDSHEPAIELAARLSEMAVARGGKPLTTVIEPKQWGGQQIERSADKTKLTMHMHHKAMATVREWLPTLAETGVVPTGIPTGTALQRALDELTLLEGTGPLTQDQKDVRSITGQLRWLTKRIMRIVKHTWKLSCIQGRASEGAKTAALGVVALVYFCAGEGHTWDENAVDGSFRGVLKGTVDARRGTSIRKVDVEAREAAVTAPKELEGVCDATWSRGQDGTADVYALAITFKGAAVLVELKKSPIVGGSSADLESLGLLKLSDKAVWARIVASRLGIDTGPAMTLLCDAEAALRASMGEASVVRLKHIMRRAAIVRDRVLEGSINMAHVPDAANAVDIFTKWTKAEKVERMLAYLSGGQTLRLPVAPPIVVVLAVLADWLGVP